VTSFLGFFPVQQYDYARSYVSNKLFNFVKLERAAQVVDPLPFSLLLCCLKPFFLRFLFSLPTPPCPVRYLQRRCATLLAIFLPGPPGRGRPWTATTPFYVGLIKSSPPSRTQPSEICFYLLLYRFPPPHTSLSSRGVVIQKTETFHSTSPSFHHTPPPLFLFFFPHEFKE